MGAQESQEGKDERVLRIGQRVLIADHPYIKSIIGREATIVGFPFTLTEKEGEMRVTPARSHSLYAWVRVDGVTEVEYRVKVGDLL